MKKRVFALLIAAILMLVSLIGCSTPAGTDTASNENAAEDTKTNADAEEEAAEAGEEDADAGEESSDGAQVFTVLHVRNNSIRPYDFLEEEGGIMKQLEENANVDIEWDIRVLSDWNEQKSLFFAAGQMPDAFFGNTSVPAADFAENKDYFIDLTEYINEDIMPNFMKACEENPDLLAICTSRDGHIYSLPKILPLRPQVCGDDTYINTAFLDALGMEMPTTIDELAEFLIACGTEDPDGDGEADTWGITGNAGGGVMGGDLRHILAPYGTMVSRAGNYMGLDKNGTPVYVPATENYKEAVKWMKYLWDNGAIDPEYFTQDSSAATSKRQAEGGSQVGLCWGWTADGQVGMNLPDFKVLEAVEGYDGTHYVEAASNYLDISDREFLITTECKDPVALLKWADQFYTDEVTMQTYYGTIGKQIQDNGDGTYTVIPPADGSSLDAQSWSNSVRDFGPKFMSKSFYDKVILPPDQGDGAKLAQDAINGKYVTTDKNCGLPVMQYEDDELAELTTLQTDLKSYAEQMYANWVTGVSDIDDDWDGYIEQLKAMGLDRYVEIHSNAYKAFKE